MAITNDCTQIVGFLKWIVCKKSYQKIFKRSIEQHVEIGLSVMSIDRNFLTNKITVYILLIFDISVAGFSSFLLRPR